MFSKLGKSMDVKIWQLIEKVTGNFTVSAPLSHFVNEISKEKAARLSGKLSCNWLIMLVTMATPISSHVKGFKQYLRAMKIWFLVKDKIVVFHQYLWNKDVFVMNLLSSKSISINKSYFLPNSVIIAVRTPTVMATLSWVFRFWQQHWNSLS